MFAVLRSLWAIPVWCRYARPLIISVAAWETNSWNPRLSYSSIFIRKSDSVQCTEKLFACLEILKIVSFVFFLQRVFGLCQLLSKLVLPVKCKLLLRVPDWTWEIYKSSNLKKGLQMKKIVSILKAKKKSYIRFQIRPNNAPALLIFCSLTTRFNRGLFFF